MAKSDYLARGDDAFAAQLATFKNNLSGYATLLGVSAAQTATVAADADYFAGVLANQKVMQNSASQWSGWKDLIRDGGTVPPTGAPVAPTLPASATAVAPGVEVRFRALVRQLKAHPAYNETIGRALGIEGADGGPVDVAAAQPVLRARIRGDGVLVEWGWMGVRDAVDMIEIQVDRGDGKGYQLLTFDTTPDYLDTAPPPATAARWKYRAIYRAGDRRVGQWSADVSVTVGG